jgi:predicted TIM-barrel fold metal-dependent hydrolase
MEKMQDALSLFGSYPFRKTDLSWGKFLSTLAGRGFAKTRVVRIEPLFRRNPYDGSQAFRSGGMAPWIEARPLFMVNPGYARTDEIMKERVEGETDAVVLSPAYHGYKLNSPAAVRCTVGLARRGVPTVVLGLIEDIRQMHRGYKLRFPVTPEDAADYLRAVRSAFSGTPKVLLSHFAFADLRKIEAESGPEVYVDFASSATHGQPYDQVSDLVELFGEEHVLLSTGFSMKYPSVSLYKLFYSGITARQKEKISTSNVADFYGR